MPNPFPGDTTIGTAEPYAWPGGYPIGYLCADGEFICAACVNDPSNPVGTSEDTAEDWRVVGFQVLEGSAEDYEGGINCEHCGKVLVEDDPPNEDKPHEGHYLRFTGAWFCDTCNSPYCELA